MMPSESGFDVVVLGAGPAGEATAASLREHALSVAIVEPNLVGGECAFYACMPSKALLRPAEVLAEARRGPGAAEAITGELDVGAALARRDRVVHHLTDDAKLEWLATHEIELIRGRGRLDGERRVCVGSTVIEARIAVVIAVGSEPALPPIAGLARARPWTNREATVALAIPQSLLVLGGGVVGVELAQAYRELGAAVTLVEAHDRLVANEEEFAAEELRAALLARGVDIRLGVEVTSVRRSATTVTAALANGETLSAAEILVATGRAPSTRDIGLERVGLEPGGPIDVDEQYRVPAAPWLYAVGDVNGRWLLTHVAKQQARIAAAAIAGAPLPPARDLGGAPRVIFTDPQVAAVGMTLAEARRRGLAAEAYDVPTSDTPGASFHGRETAGTSRIVVDERRGVIVGATFTGFEVAEWLQAASFAIAAELPVDLLWDAPPAFPTRSEVWLRLLQRREAALRTGAATF